MSAQGKTARHAASPVTADEFAARLAAFAPSKHLAVAFSGGPDSLALLILAAQWAKRRKAVSLHAFTVDHGLRAASAAEAKRAAGMARALGVPHRILRWTGAKPASGIQAAAREARYRLLLDACRTAGASDLLVAHHLEDQAETFLLRLARGSGVDGLSAMAPARPLTEDEPSVRLLRPLLDLPRDRLLATVRRSGLQPVEDPSNENEAFDRVKARKALAALAPLGLDAARLARTAGQMARARAALESATAALLSGHAVLSPFGHVEAESAALAAAPRETGLRALALIIRIVGGNNYSPRLEALDALYDALVQGKLGAGRTLAGVKLAASGARLIATRELAAAMKAEPLALRAGEQALWDGRFRVSLPKAPRGQRLVVRALGQAGLAQLAAHDIVIPKAPKSALLALPGLWREGALVAAPHLGTLDPRIACHAALRRPAAFPSRTQAGKA
jgi:tRNA(Ile)-lysidine synthase